MAPISKTAGVGACWSDYEGGLSYAVGFAIDPAYLSSM